MDKNYNEMTFYNMDEAVKLLHFLLDYNTNRKDLATDGSGFYNDIHIYQEEDLIVVAWAQVPENHEYGGQFQFVDEDQQIVTEFLFPDNALGYEFTPGDKEEMLKDWLAQNPGWHQNCYGRWVQDQSDMAEN